MYIGKIKSHKKFQLISFIQTGVMGIFVICLLMKKSKNPFFSKRARYFLVLYPLPNNPKGTLEYHIETSDMQDNVSFLALRPSVTRKKMSLTARRPKYCENERRGTFCFHL